MKSEKGKNESTVRNLTEGALLPIIVRFTIPLVLGNILQLTYNAVDSIIVGKFVGSTALAAVGTSNPIMTLIIMFVQGISLGSGILIGNLFGAGEYGKMKRQVSTAMISGSVFSLAVGIAVLLLAGPILHVMQVDPVIIPHAAVYLRVIASGLIFNYIYNFFASTLRALGDSRSPLIFLGVSAAVNIAGDLLFVVGLGAGVTGCAVSTVMSEALSCLFCWLYIKRKVPLLDMGREWLIFDSGMLKKTLSYGSVSALQQSTVQLGIVGVQGVVNSLGVAVTAAFAAANRIDDFALIPGRNIAHAMTSVMAQNEGAGKKARVRKTFFLGILLDAGYGLLSGIVLLLFSDFFMRLFTVDAEVIREGENYLRLIALMYVLPSCTNAIQGYFRGIGDLRITLVSSIMNMGVRFAACFLMVFHFHMGIEAVPWACMAGWVSMLAYELPFLFVSLRKRRSVHKSV